MFGWLGELTNSITNAISAGFSQIGVSITNTVFEAMLIWIYNLVWSACADFFTLMGNMGAEIFELTYEDGKVNVKTSPASRIYISTERRETRWVEAKQELLTEATFDITNYLSRIDKSEIANPYIRLTVIDKEGKKAHTRAYFVDELI